MGTKLTKTDRRVLEQVDLWVEDRGWLSAGFESLPGQIREYNSACKLVELGILELVRSEAVRAYTRAGRLSRHHYIRVRRTAK